MMLVVSLVLIIVFAISASAEECVGSHSYDTNGFCTVCDAYQPIEPASGVYQITNAGNNAINGKLMTDINLNPGYTFTFDPDTGLVEVTNGTNTVYLGTYIKGASRGNIYFDETASTAGSFYSLSGESYTDGTAPVDFADGTVAWLLNTAGMNTGEAGYKHYGKWSQGANYPIFADSSHRATFRISVSGAKSTCYYTDAAGKCASLETVYIDGISVATIHTADTSYTAETAITSAQPILGSSITMIYEANILTSLIGDSTPKMVFTYHEKTYTVEVHPVTPVGAYTHYTFAFTEITPQCMGDLIDASLTIDGKEATKMDYSMKAYCDTMLAKSDAELGGLIPATSTPAEFKKLLGDILLYGVASQTYTGYKTDVLVSNGEINFTPLTETDKTVSGTKNDNAYFNAAGLWFANINKIYWKVKTTDTSKLTVKYSKSANTYCIPTILRLPDSVGFIKRLSVMMIPTTASTTAM